jgi:hypothetical protein
MVQGAGYHDLEPLRTFVLGVRYLEGMRAFIKLVYVENRRDRCRTKNLSNICSRGFVKLCDSVMVLV